MRLAAEGRDGIGPQRSVRREDDPGAPVHPGEFFHGDGVADDVETGAAVFDVVGDAHPAVLAHFADDFRGKGILLVEAKGNGLDFLLREGADLLMGLFRM